MLSIVPQSMRWRHHGANLNQVKLTSPPADGSHRGFTLIELLTVIAIIGILSAITFGIVKGVNERAAIGQAKAELGTIAQALEAYKRQYGDYPQTGRFTASSASSPAIAPTSESLFNALQGWVGPKNNTLSKQGKIFVDTVSLALANEKIPTTGKVNNAFVDPWGRQYIYSYRTKEADGGGWKLPGYVLLSAGPDGKLIAPDTSGVLDNDKPENLDNIYFNR